MMKASWLLLSLFLASQTAWASSTLRCGSQLISQGDDQVEVQSKCGQPVSQDFIGYRERTDEWGFNHSLAVEEWVYGPRNGMYQFLRFEGGRLTTIRSKRR